MSAADFYLVTDGTQKVGAMIETLEACLEHLRSVNFETIAERSSESLADMHKIVVTQTQMFAVSQVALMLLSALSVPVESDAE